MLGQLGEAVILGDEEVDDKYISNIWGAGFSRSRDIRHIARNFPGLWFPTSSYPRYQWYGIRTSLARISSGPDPVGRENSPFSKGDARAVPEGGPQP